MSSLPNMHSVPAPLYLRTLWRYTNAAISIMTKSASTAVLSVMWKKVHIIKSNRLTIFSHGPMCQILRKQLNSVTRQGIRYTDSSGYRILHCAGKYIILTTLFHSQLVTASKFAQQYQQKVHNNLSSHAAE